ncbi:M1 family metallopeptidase [Thermodesulfobacteriota bacterium]
MEISDYNITIEPDLKEFTFSGQTEVRIRAIEAIEEITLHALELTVLECFLIIDKDKMPCAFELHPEKESLQIRLPRKQKGHFTVSIEYHGVINDRMAGFYRSSYSMDGQTRYIAVTQFQESDARRAFPCLDHPVHKAVFNIEIIADENLVVVSNTPVAETLSLGNGKNRVRFEPTPKMSTYLVFFGMGDFEIHSDELDNRVRSVTLPGMKSNARFGLEFARKALFFCEDYYGVPYPLAKLDLLAIPDFAFGAMENWGAVTFRENLLLHYPDVTSRSGETRICEVIAHEIAHQWFGNLVTPSEWKYLWLNESFATYFGYGVVDHFHPEWATWDHFLRGQTESALVRDGLHETFPIEIPGGEHVVINTSTAPIIYSKGGSILRQIEGYVGKETFRKGLHHYLNKHAYACTESHHLWEALEEISGKPVSGIMQNWIEQQGFPMVEVNRQNGRLHLFQQRFTYLPNESRQRWQIPMTLRIYDPDGKEREITALILKRETILEIGDQAVAYTVNAGRTGFFRTRYLDESNLNELARRVEEKQLPSEDRWGLENDLYALVRKGDVLLDDYLTFLNHYMYEDAFLPLAGINDSLFHAYLVMNNPFRDRIATEARPILKNAFERMGYHPAVDEPHALSVLRDQLIWTATLFGDPETLAFGADAFRRLKSGGNVHPDILKSTLQVGAYTGSADVFDWLDQRFRSAVSEHERQNILIAMGCFQDKSLMDKIGAYVLENVPDRNRFIPIASMAANPSAIPGMWDWYVSHTEKLEQSHPLLYERVIAAIIPICGMGKVDAIKEFFHRYTQEKPMLHDVVRISLEKLEINSRMVALNQPG